MHISLYALLFLTVLLGVSVLLESYAPNREVKHKPQQPIPAVALQQETTYGVVQ